MFDHALEEPIFKVVWDRELSEEMLNAWTNYGKYGYPNVTLGGGRSIEWKEYGTDGNVIILDDNIRMESGFKMKYRNDVCDFWCDEIGEDIMQSICLSLKDPS